ncbi:MAG: F0F1 ATP synthase subunit epsilon [Methanothrix sp.]|jgi:alternate F1F0 ATPase, F1 subunit epsilon|uniref:Alternate F1F0 ATPase, F1 subunit epsilon n=1 Tax=Methanothrix harundinacea TaxID=301375 RepID=A0A117LFR5_9EURY|nr:MAG: ATP synthase F0F1 subunit epsilon [Methanosaeta sp. SDB]KUK44758.1 MAG: Alternate F1F0 ATPase, F1 subunit epsilon [Methanothrix harundinacea]MDD2637694.1 F0F1 ATP synthase subunit epsilon [Methanothrix sp.]MDI9399477.1 F0F1 ATP synthase subunit epsilon [Euryarchaeota archaeon]MCP1392917.1 F0F1 ATP synthase subunit epsilon [Methanothrix harundinacea]
MRLKVLLPTTVFVDEEVAKVVAEAENGSFCILPKHIDFVAALVPGILSFESDQGEEFLATDEGILVKCASQVVVSTRKAMRSRDLGMLKRTVREEFRSLDEREKKTRTILAKLEADFAKSVFEKM